MPKSYLFFLRVYNDIDHITPVIWKMARQGHRVEVLFLDLNSNIAITDVPHFKFLNEEASCAIRYYYALKIGWARLPNRALVNPGNPLAFKLWQSWIRKGLLRLCTKRWVRRVFDTLNPAALLFDWHEPEPGSLEDRFIQIAEERGIPALALPHGLHFLHWETPRPRPQARETPYNRFEKILEPDRGQRPYWLTQGVEEARLAFLGSPRYCREWQTQARRMIPAYRPRSLSVRKVKILFFLPKWLPSVDRAGTLKALEAIASFEDVTLLIKEHTREGAGSLPGELREKLNALAHVEVIRSSQAVSWRDWLRRRGEAGGPATDSAALVQWADVVINIRSSVGIEAFTQAKLLIQPRYLCTERTIFDAYGAGCFVDNLEALLAEIKRIITHGVSITYNNSAFLREVVAGGGSDADVLQRYANFIVAAGK